MKLDLNAEKSLPEIKILSIVFRENLLEMPNQSPKTEGCRDLKCFMDF